MKLSQEQFFDVLKTVAKYDCCDDLYWHQNLDIYVLCNDLFSWATADAEELTPENVSELERAFVDAAAVGASHSGGALFCARIRGMRPQPPFYKYFPESLHELLDFCGPERDPKSCG